MESYKCPHCQKPGITIFRKMSLGPALPAECMHCERKVGVPYTALFALIPFIGSLGLLLTNLDLPYKVLGLVIGILAMFVIHMKWVPLEKR